VDRENIHRKEVERNTPDAMPPSNRLVARLLELGWISGYLTRNWRSWSTRSKRSVFPRQFADFIEKNRSGVRQLKTALSSLKRPVNLPSHAKSSEAMSQKDRCAVYTDERLA